MSSFLYPSTILGLGFTVMREPRWNTGVQRSLTGKRSTIAYQPYPLMHYELNYSVLRDDLTPSDFKSIVGLFNSLQGQFDSFLFTDPDFNLAQDMQFGVGTGSLTTYQITATFENTGGPGGAEIIQNFNGSPSIYINRYGLLEAMASAVRENFLLQSQAFNTTWTLGHATVTANTTVAPDGTTTADSIFEDTTTNPHGVVQAVTVPSATGPYTMSVFLNPGLTRTWAVVVLTETLGSSQAYAYFNLSGSGSIGTTVTGANWSNVSATITPCNNGFYRCTVSATKTNAATTLDGSFYPATANGVDSYAGNTSDGIIAWGAQLENEPHAYMYLPTTTSAVSQNDYTLGSTGIVTFTSAPPLNSLLLWSGNFYYRCAFDEDGIEFAKFMNQWWTAKVKFSQVLL